MYALLEKALRSHAVAVATSIASLQIMTCSVQVRECEVHIDP